MDLLLIRNWSYFLIRGSEVGIHTGYSCITRIPSSNGITLSHFGPTTLQHLNLDKLPKNARKQPSYNPKCTTVLTVCIDVCWPAEPSGGGTTGREQHTYAQVSTWCNGLRGDGLFLRGSEWQRSFYNVAVSPLCCFSSVFQLRWHT